MINSSAPRWALPFVLIALSNEPLEPFMRAPPNILSLKTALLLSLTSAEGVSDLCALLVCPSCLLMREDLTDATLKIGPLHPTMLKLCLAQGHFRQMHSIILMKGNGGCSIAFALCIFWFVM